MSSLFQRKDSKGQINRKGDAFKLGMYRTCDGDFVVDEFTLASYKTKMRIIIIAGSHGNPFGKCGIGVYFFQQVGMNKHFLGLRIGIGGNASLGFKIKFNGIALKTFSALLKFGSLFSNASFVSR